MGRSDYRREGNVTTETVWSSMATSQEMQASLEDANTLILVL